MKRTAIVALAAWGGVAFADPGSFVRAYDAGDFDGAAGQLEGLDTADPGIARRLGVLYYKGQGVACDRAKGLALLEQAMTGGDATAAVNLAKIYFMTEKNVPKAAWCLFVAESLKDASVRNDVTRLRGCLGDGYLKGVASYVAQLQDVLASERAALKDKASEAERERTSLTRQIESCQAKAKEKVETFAREREALTAEKENLGQKLAAAEKAMATDRERIEELNAKVAEAASARSSLDKVNEEHAASKRENAARGEEIERLKRELAEAATEARKVGEELAAANKRHQEVLGKYNALVASSNQKASSYENALAEAKTAAEEANRKHQELQSKYTRLVEKYNDLVREYNRLFKIYRDATANGSEHDGSVAVAEVKAESEEDTKTDPHAGRFGRGWNTFFCAPCNFVRAIAATGRLYDETEKVTNGGYAFFIAAIGAPIVFCCEIVPTVCDLGNGLADMISLGAYGDWLYSGSIESRWYERDDSHFPWLDRKWRAGEDAWAKDSSFP